MLLLFQSLHHRQLLYLVIFPSSSNPLHSNSYVNEKSQNTERKNVCVVVYKLQKHGNDINNIWDLYKYLGCNANITNADQIDQRLPFSKKPCVLEVQLQSTSDKTTLLRFFKFLKHDPSTASMLITP